MASAPFLFCGIFVYSHSASGYMPFAFMSATAAWTRGRSSRYVTPYHVS